MWVMFKEYYANFVPLLKARLVKMFKNIIPIIHILVIWIIFKTKVCPIFFIYIIYHIFIVLCFTRFTYFLKIWLFKNHKNELSKIFNIFTNITIKCVYYNRQSLIRVNLKAEIINNKNNPSCIFFLFLYNSMSLYNYPFHVL